MQNDLISRSDAIKRAKAAESKMGSVNGIKAVPVDSVVQFLSILPAVDAVEVVRCRECKYSELEFFADNGTIRIETYKCFHHRMGINVLDRDDFCSYGERRADDG